MLRQGIADGHTLRLRHWEGQLSLASCAVSWVFLEKELQVKVKVEHFGKFLDIGLLVGRVNGRIGSRLVGQTRPAEVIDDFKSGATIDIFLAKFANGFDREGLARQEVETIHVVLGRLVIYGCLLELVAARVNDERQDIGVDFGDN